MTEVSPALGSEMVCGGCGTAVPAHDPYPFRCPRAGEPGDVDHVLRRVLDARSVSFPPATARHGNPFIWFRGLLHAHHLATAGGMTDEAFVGIVRELDDAVAEVGGSGFAVTPARQEPALATGARIHGPLLVKDETGNVAGSHKARHLFGVLVHLEVARRLELPGERPDAPLAIASCGNAALAAAVVARAGNRVLQVFVPTDADAGVVERLRALGAEVSECPRVPGVVGDPAYLALKDALAHGALPFTCQGNQNGLAVEGGMTLAYELVADLAGGAPMLDHIVVQVGGGALASSIAQGFADAVALGVLDRAPRFHTVQTDGAAPLARAFVGIEKLDPHAAVALGYAAAHRSEFMWPWDTVPHSVAHGILDDETYDWLAVCEAMLATGGRATVVSEEEIINANQLAVEHTGIPVDETGSAGLAGLMRLRADGVVKPGESAAVVFTGARR